MLKFIAQNLDAAKRKANRALGDKTVVVSVRDLPSGDVEVTASDKPTAAAPAPAPTQQFGDQAREAIEAGPLRADAGRRLDQSMESHFVEDALSQLGSKLTGGKPAPRFDMSDNTVRGMAALLADHHLGQQLLAALIDGAKKSPIDEDLHRLKTGFETAFSFAPIEFSPATPIMLVGPTGAGKTSCAAKLAAASAASCGEAFMMTADVGRAGAVEQIRSYGDALGVDYFIVESPMDVQQALRAERPSGVVILDTPGVSPYDGGDIAALKSFQEACGAEPVLVLPASGDAAEYLDWAAAFKEIGVRRIILTKFDATKRVGAGLCAAFERDLALAHFSETPFISEGLLPATPDFIAKRMIAAKPGQIR